MKSSEKQGASNKELLKGSGVNADEATGVPLLKSWRAVYWFVLASFLLWVAVLTALTRLYK